MQRLAGAVPETDCRISFRLQASPITEGTKPQGPPTNPGRRGEGAAKRALRSETRAGSPVAARGAMPPLLGGADLWRPAAAARGGGWATAAALLVVIVSHLAVLLIRRRLRRPGGVDRIAPTEAAPASASASGLVHPYSARCPFCDRKMRANSALVGHRRWGLAGLIASCVPTWMMVGWRGS